MLYYFPHPTNLRINKDVIRMRRQEGAAGYGIYVMLLELVRDSEDQQVFDDPESLAFAIHEDDVSMITRICHDYSLFTLTDDGYLRSPFLAMCQQQADERAAKAREWGKMGAKARYSRADQRHPSPEPGLDPGAAAPISAADHGNVPYALPIGGGMPDPCLNQNEQPKGKEKESNQQPTKSKLKDLEWLGVSGEYWLDLCRSSSKMTAQDIERLLSLPPVPGHNQILLVDWIRKYGISKALFAQLGDVTESWRVGSPAFQALHAALKHARDTQYTPAHPSEYLISTAIKFYNQV